MLLFLRTIQLLLICLIVIFGYSHDLMAEDYFQDTNRLTGVISKVKKGKIGCDFSVKSKGQIYHFYADYKYCFSARISVGNFVKVDWRHEFVDDCEYGYGCGKYIKRPTVLAVEPYHF